MREHTMIALLSNMLGRSPKQLNLPFESDAEFVRLGETIYGFSIDEHNPAEDRFTSFDPETLGWNLVVCTVSDLLAAGVRPAFYLHSMTLPKAADDAFCNGLIRGMSAALQAEGCALLGGDTSFAADWRYVGVALGPTERPILRSGVQSGDLLYATGRLGSGNRQALLSLLLEQQRVEDTPEIHQLASVRFPCRRVEAERAWSDVRAGIDTSDGLAGALRDLRRVNKECGFIVEQTSGLLDPQSASLMRRLGLPLELLLFGSLGEYELLFCISAAAAERFVADLATVGCVPIRVGEVTDQPGTWFGGTHRRVPVDLDSLPDPRDLDSNEYLERMLTWTAALHRELEM